MALPPDTQNEAFLREVEENYRRDRLESFAKTYGLWIAIGVILLLASVGGWLYWQNRQKAEAARQTEELHRIFGDVGSGREEGTVERLETVAADSDGAIRAVALLTAAAVALESNDRAEALAKYRAVADDKSLPDAYRDLALVRRTAIEFDTLDPKAVVARLEPIAKADNAWFGSAGELVALAYVKQGQREKAGKLFAAIAADPQVPETLRSRAVQIASTLGVDASGSLPIIQAQESTQ